MKLINQSMNSEATNLEFLIECEPIFDHDQRTLLTNTLDFLHRSTITSTIKGFAGFYENNASSRCRLNERIDSN